MSEDLTPTRAGRMKFSSILDGLNEATSIRYNNKVAGLKKAGDDIIVLSLGEAFFDLPLLSFDELPHPTGFHYSDSRGIIELRTKIAEYYQRKFSVAVDPAQEILITAGSKAAIYMGLLSILDPGDEVIVPEPAWVSYSQQIALCHGTYVGVPIGTSTKDFPKFVTPRTRALVINSPHNPTGKLYSREELSLVLELAIEHSLWIISDEAYSDFVTGNYTSVGALDRSKSNSLIFNSLSKNFGISGWRLGYVIGHPEAIQRILKANQHIVTCPATVLEYYAARYFDEIEACTAPQIAKLLKTREETASFMREIGLNFREGDSAFYFFVSIKPSKLGSEAFAEKLLQTSKVAVVPGIGYGLSCDGYVRVSVGTEPTGRVYSGLKKMAQLINETA